METTTAPPPVDLDASATASAAADVTAPRPQRQPATPDAGGFVWGTGRRKSAIARVRVRPAREGKTVYLINGREVDAYFTEVRDREMVRSPLKQTQTEDRYEIHVRVAGGGFAGQAGAVRLGLARALCGQDPALEPTLRDNGMLTRDPRKVERKKYGQPGARRRFQFSKR